MNILVYGVNDNTTTKWWRLQVGLKQAKHEATRGSEAHRRKPNQWIESELRQVAPLQCELFNESFQHLVRQLFQEDGTKAISPQVIFAKTLTQMNTAADDDVGDAANMTPKMCEEFRLHWSNAETKSTTWLIACMDSITNQLGRDINCFNSSEQMQFNKEYSNCCLVIEVW